MAVELALMGLAIVGAVFVSYGFAMCYCRVRATEENQSRLWYAARPIGILVGGVVWVVGRMVTPEIATGPEVYPFWMRLVTVFVVSAVLVGLMDLVLHWVFIAQPSFAEAREAYLEHGSTSEDGKDWIDATLYSEGES